MPTCGTCPFCGLLCSGISFPLHPAHAQTLSDVGSACERSRLLWSLAHPTPAWQLKPLRNGRPLPANVAIDEVCQQLARSRRTLFSGLGTDVAGMRHIIDYARQVGGILDHMNSDALQRNLSLLQRGGWIATTLSEIRFRADVIILVGDSLLERFPRLLSLLLDRTQRPTKNSPKIFWLGTDDIRFKSQAMLVPEVQTIALRKIEWLSTLSSLLQRTQSRIIETDPLAKAGSQPSAALKNWIQSLPSAAYSAWIWSAADFLSAGDELILDILVRLVQELNQSSRAAVLPLAGSQGDTTAQQVCTWKTGFPLRQALSPAGVDYQPNRYRFIDVLNHHDCDAAIHISTFEPLEPPDEFWRIPGAKIVMGHPALKAATRADYFFPTGIPGVDHESHMFRGDGVAVISIERKREPLAPSASDWFHEFMKSHTQPRGWTTSVEK